MALNITARHSHISDKQREYIEKKIDRLSRLVDQIDEINFTLDEEKLKHKVEIRFRSHSISAFAKCEDENTYAAIDKAIDKVAQQVNKAKSKRNDKKIHATESLRHPPKDEVNAGVEEIE